MPEAWVREMDGHVRGFFNQECGDDGAGHLRSLPPQTGRDGNRSQHLHTDPAMLVPGAQAKLSKEGLFNAGLSAVYPPSKRATG